MNHCIKISFCSILLFTVPLIFSQEKSSGLVSTNQSPDQTFTKFKNDQPLSAEDQILLNKIIKIKNSGDVSRQGELDEILKKFNRNNGLIEKQAKRYDGRVFTYQQNALNKIESQTDFIYGRLVKSFGTATEQTGINYGRAWIVYTHGNFSTGGDTLGIYSTDGSGTYILRGGAILSSNDIFYGGNLDVEIVEKNSGDKILYAFFTYSTLNTTIRKIGGVALDINSGTISIFTLHWPNQTNNENYYNVHITSDNCVDSSTTWLYIACSMDSIGTNGHWFYGQKFAYIYQTNVTPTITYRASVLPVFWQSGDGYPSRNLYTDIAYFRDGSNAPSLLFTYSNIPDSTKIWLTKSSSTGSGATLLGTLGSSYHINNSAIVAPGGIGNQQLMVIGTQNYQNSGDWDVVSFKTNNEGSNWSQYYIEGFSSTTTRLPSWPDIYVKWKDENNYRVSYNLGTANPNWLPDSVMYVKSVAATGNNWEQAVRISTPNVFQPEFISKVGFLGNTSDDCLVLWGDINFGGLYATYCGAILDVNDNQQLPQNFSLSNNYPNPFNPSTKIEYNISEIGLVLLKVYDLLGREVVTLVNEEKPAGSYNITFDANKLPSGVYYYRLASENFIETKKMVLIK